MEEGILYYICPNDECRKKYTINITEPKTPQKAAKWIDAFICSECGFKNKKTFNTNELKELMRVKQSKKIVSETAKQIKEKLLNSDLSVLPVRNCKVLEMRFGLKDNVFHSLEEVGEEFGVTRERIRQLEQKAFKLLGINTESYKQFINL